MAGYKFALEPDFNLVSYVEREHENHDNLLREQGIGDSFLHYKTTPDLQESSTPG
jgi:hypothetical protein